ncbi:NAD(P)/FAD-dependent oxidoreductase [Prevotella sp. E15-22]|uniref:dihydrolipoyl dehydrogenase family protein n=1 Tax=Prevotella sp. E15-22 TaxID=2937774 RepID=UPI00205DFDE3|nr:NAD(P)/FAD-dependent oxidoreductase [Prevotella sp. E15-22]UPS43809.1 NAD(P)/FAD-dependent oxidoreductase [Prevotella sp. E15-22]
MNKTDLIIIGAGPGGYRAAEYAAKQGLKVAIFEGSEVGGTCLNVGCIPTKTYVHSASFDEARERMATVVTQLRQGVEGILSHPNITLVREKGVFVDAHTVGDYTADNIIIATGSETKWLPIKGVDDPRVVDSTGLLQLETLPKRLTIIGAGVIGMEFASVFNRFGSEVTVIEYLKECLPALDSDIAKRLRKYLEKQGITFKMKTAVEDIADIDADVVLMATGRKPRVQADFANAGVEYDERKGVAVDENFKTAVNGIYAIGDVNGKQMLAHAAEMQAVHAVNHILNKEDAIRFDIMPAAIFTTPEAACVGLTEDQLKEQGYAYECRKAFHRVNGKALTMNETEGMLKLFSEPEAGRILGCHVFGAHSADMVQEVSVLMCRDTTVSQLRDMVHIHPTVNELLLTAAQS